MCTLLVILCLNDFSLASIKLFVVDLSSSLTLFGQALCTLANMSSSAEHGGLTLSSGIHKLAIHELALCITLAKYLYSTVNFSAIKVTSH